MPHSRALPDRGHQHGGGLVDDGVGVHQPRVGKADPAIVVGDRGQPLGAIALAPRRQRIVLGDGGQALEQPAHRRHVAGDVALQPAADGILEQRIEVDGGAQLVARLLVGEAQALVADPRRARRRDPRCGRSRARPCARFCVERSSSAPQIRASSVSPCAISSAKRLTRYCGVLPPWNGCRSAAVAWRCRRWATLLGGLVRAAEGRGEARADVGKELQHGHRIDLAAERFGRRSRRRCRPAPAGRPRRRRRRCERSLDGGLVVSVIWPQPTRMGVRGSIISSGP